MAGGAVKRMLQRQLSMGFEKWQSTAAQMAAEAAALRRAGRHARRRRRRRAALVAVAAVACRRFDGAAKVRAVADDAIAQPVPLLDA